MTAHTRDSGPSARRTGRVWPVLWGGLARLVGCFGPSCGVLWPVLWGRGVAYPRCFSTTYSVDPRLLSLLPLLPLRGVESREEVRPAPPLTLRDRRPWGESTHAPGDAPVTPARRVCGCLTSLPSSSRSCWVTRSPRRTAGGWPPSSSAPSALGCGSRYAGLANRSRGADRVGTADPDPREVVDLQHARPKVLDVKHCSPRARGRGPAPGGLCAWPVEKIARLGTAPGGRAWGNGGSVPPPGGVSGRQVPPLKRAGAREACACGGGASGYRPITGRAAGCLR